MGPSGGLPAQMPTVHSLLSAQLGTAAALCVTLCLAKVRFPLPLQTKRYDVNVELDGYNHDLR